MSLDRYANISFNHVMLISPWWMSRMLSCWLTLNVCIQFRSWSQCFSKSNSKDSIRTEKYNWSMHIATVLQCYSNIFYWSLLTWFHSQNVQVPTRRWKLAATKREQEKWDKAAKASTAGSVSCALSVAKSFSINCYDKIDFGLLL